MLVSWARNSAQSSIFIDGLAIVHGYIQFFTTRCTFSRDILCLEAMLGRVQMGRQLRIAPTAPVTPYMPHPLVKSDVSVLCQVVTIVEDLGPGQPVVRAM